MRGVLMGLLLKVGLIPVLFAQPIQQAVRLTQVAPGCYVHTTNSPGPANGLVVHTTEGAVLIDTGWNPAQTRQLYRQVRRKLGQPVVLCIITHCHIDRMGGAAWLRRKGVRVISTRLTARRMEAVGYTSAEGILPSDSTFTLGGQTFETYFPGAGHAPDNIVVWLPQPRLLFGGCLIKSLEANALGNLSDANLEAWASSVRRVMVRFNEAQLVVPGHQAWGDSRSLQHTLDLLAAPR